MSFSTPVASSVVNGQSTDLAAIERLDEQLQQFYANRFAVQSMLTRSLVSFQANKARPVYRWYKYKEAFSAALVEYFLQRFQITHGTIMDPFAGSGTTLFAASVNGLDAHGIELLPIGQQIIATKKLLDSGLERADLARLEYWANEHPWEQTNERVPLPELRITRGAYPPETHEAIERYLGACQQEKPHVQAILRFALLCVLESVSYTRKDGQYLRWDDRSGRRVGHKPFDKGIIVEFAQAIHDKLSEIMADLAPTAAQLELFANQRPQGEIVLFRVCYALLALSVVSLRYDTQNLPK